MSNSFILVTTSVPEFPGSFRVCGLPLGGVDLDLLGPPARNRYWLVILAQALDVKLDALSNQFPDSFTSGRRSDTSGQVGHVGRPVPWPLLIDHYVFH